MTAKHPLNINHMTRTGALFVLSACLAFLSACTVENRQTTLADEMEANGQIAPEWARKLVWKDATALSSQHLPFFSLAPAIAQYLESNQKWQINLSGGTNSGGAVKLLNASRTKSLNATEGPKLVAQLLDNANVKPSKILPCCSRLLFSEKLLFLVSVDPAVLMVVPATLEKQQMPGYLSVMSRSFQIRTDVVTARAGASFNEGSGVILAGIFPNLANIEVVSDQWAGVRTLAQMEADNAVPFKVVPAVDVPGFLRVVLKDPGKAR